MDPFVDQFRDRFRDRFRRSQPKAQTCETQAVDQVVDQLWDRCSEATRLKLRRVRHRLWISSWFDLGISFIPSHRLAQSRETQAVDPFVHRFRDQRQDRFSTPPA